MGIRRSFLALAMARTISCATRSNAAITWPVRCGQLCGDVSRPPAAPSSSPSPSLLIAQSPSQTTGNSSSSINSRRCTSVGSYHRIGRRWRGQQQLLFVGGLSTSRPGHERYAFTRQSAGANRGVLTMAQPRKKLPQRSVDVFCQKCRTQLYRYKKGGKGSLVKCYKERIVEDFTGGKLECPNCGQLFARDTMVHGKPAFKMIGGKVYQKK